MGTIHIVYGKKQGLVDIDLLNFNPSNGLVIYNKNTTGTKFARSLSTGDINGDGISDVLNYYGENSGCGAYIIYGMLMSLNMLDLRSETSGITANLLSRTSTGTINPIP